LFIGISFAVIVIIFQFTQLIGESFQISVSHHQLVTFYHCVIYTQQRVYQNSSSSSLFVSNKQSHHITHLQLVAPISVFITTPLRSGGLSTCSPNTNDDGSPEANTQCIISTVSIEGIYTVDRRQLT
jgi:hypothetical protein